MEVYLIDRVYLISWKQAITIRYTSITSIHRILHVQCAQYLNYGVLERFVLRIYQTFARGENRIAHHLATTRQGIPRFILCDHFL